MRRYVVYGRHTLDIEDHDITLDEIRNSMADLFPEVRDAVLMEDVETGKISVILKKQVLQNQLDIELEKRFHKFDEMTQEAVARVERERSNAPQHVIGTSNLPGSWGQVTSGRIQPGSIRAQPMRSLSMHHSMINHYPPDLSRTEYEAAKTVANAYWDMTARGKEEKERELAAIAHRNRALQQRLDKFIKPEVKEYPYTVGQRYAERGNYTHLVGKSVKSILHDELIGVHVVKPEDEDKEYVIRASDLKQEE